MFTDSLNTSSVSTHQKRSAPPGYVHQQPTRVNTMDPTSGHREGESGRELGSVAGIGGHQDRMAATPSYPFPASWGDTHFREEHLPSRVTPASPPGASSATGATTETAYTAQAYTNTSTFAGGIGSDPSIPAPTEKEGHGKETRRQQILDHANKLLWLYRINESKGVTSVRQCSSSFFVLLYQRLFGCQIRDIDWSPNTLEKKRRNVALVLEELRRKKFDLSDISAEEVVRLNEDHISRLIMVFVQIAMQRDYHQPLLPQELLHRVGNSTGVSASMDGRGDNVLDETNAPTALHPSGYTVAEVTPLPAAYAWGPAFLDGIAYQHTPPGHTRPVKPDGVALMGNIYPEDVFSRVYSAAYAADSGDAQRLGKDGMKVSGQEGSYVGSRYEEEDDTHVEGSETKGSSYTETSIPPIDVLVENWCRGVMTPDDAELSQHPSIPTRRNSCLDTSGIRLRQRKLNEADDALRAGGGKRNVLGVPEMPSGGARYPTGSSTKGSTRTADRDGGATPSDGSRLHQRGFAPTGMAIRATAKRSDRVSAHRTRAPVFVDEPPLSQAECRLLASHPGRFAKYEERDRKIQRLCAARFLGDMQALIRQRMRRQYDEDVSEMRESLKQTVAIERRNTRDRKRQMKEENEKYRTAYASMMESAANDSRISRRLMSRNTAQLAELYAESLQESRRMCEYLERENVQRNRDDLMRYAQTVSSWQQRFVF